MKKENFILSLSHSFGELNLNFEDKTTNKVFPVLKLNTVSDTLTISRQVFVADYKKKIDLVDAESGLFIKNHDVTVMGIFNDNLNSEDENRLSNTLNIAKINAHGSFENFKLNLNYLLGLKITLNSDVINFDKKEVCYIYVNQNNGSITILLSIKYGYGDDEGFERIVIKQNVNGDYLICESFALRNLFNKDKKDQVYRDYTKIIISEVEED